MRRGLLSWSEEEVPRAVLDARVARCRDAMQASGMDALLVYTNFPRPAAVSYLTHFVPYWSQGVLLIPAEGLLVFAVSLSKRVANWVEETAHVGEIVCTPDIGRELGTLLAADPAIRRVGVLDLAKLPGMIVGNLRRANGAIELIDASEMFARLRSPADDTEIALARRATEIAHRALDLARPGAAPVTAGILSDVERAARNQGCEEVLIDIAEDLESDFRLRRLDGPSAFANRYAVRLSLAYKGHWVRVGRTFEQDDGGADRAGSVERHLGAALPRLCADAPAGFAPVGRTLEACVGAAPLTVLAEPSPGSIVSVTGRWRDDSGFWVVSEPVLLGASADEPAQPLRAG